ncbi:MAG: hypothetical protein HY287_02255 [Planctomycetes bacterium]|nr:hypothetical protein [Planctomycetota bacterium]
MRNRFSTEQIIYKLREAEADSGKVTQLFALDPSKDNQAPQEVTYHGVEAIGRDIVLEANEGRSYVDAVASCSIGSPANSPGR